MAFFLHALQEPLCVRSAHPLTAHVPVDLRHALARQLQIEDPEVEGRYGMT